MVSVSFGGFPLSLLYHIYATWTVCMPKQCLPIDTVIVTAREFPCCSARLWKWGVVAFPNCLTSQSLTLMYVATHHSVNTAGFSLQHVATHILHASGVQCRHSPSVSFGNGSGSREYPYVLKYSRHPWFDSTKGTCSTTSMIFLIPQQLSTWHVNVIIKIYDLY